MASPSNSQESGDGSFGGAKWGKLTCHTEMFYNFNESQQVYVVLPSVAYKAATKLNNNDCKTTLGDEERRGRELGDTS